MALTFTLVGGAIVLALLGAFRFSMTSNSSNHEERQWRRLQPYIYLVSGLGMFVGGWFLGGATRIPAAINIFAGAVFAGVGARRLVRRHRKSN